MKVKVGDRILCTNAENLRVTADPLINGVIYTIVDYGFDGDGERWVEVSHNGRTLMGAYSADRFVTATTTTGIGKFIELDRKVTQINKTKTKPTTQPTASSLIRVDFVNRKRLNG